MAPSLTATQRKSADCFHIVDIAKERCHRIGNLPADIVLLARPEARLMAARGHDGTTGSDTASVDLPGGTQSIQRALAVLRILATARESGLGLSEISMHAGLTRPTTHRILTVLGQHSTALQSQRSDLLQPVSLSSPESGRAVLQQDQALSSRSDAIRQTRCQLPSVRPTRVNQAVAPR
jgi:hypothetical protein